MGTSSGKPSSVADFFGETNTGRINGDSFSVEARSAKQTRYIEAMFNSIVTFGLGPAGTGKTFLSVAFAMASLEKRKAKRIIITRPAIEAGEKLGFLPGNVDEKMEPYTRPVHDILNQLWQDKEEILKRMRKGEIEVAPLAYMRGRTFDDSIVILDEAQNTSPEQMKMFLTRIGENSRMIINGDHTQNDLPRGQRSGLSDIEDILEKSKITEFVRFGLEDVQRSEAQRDILGCYTSYEQKLEQS